MHLTPAAELGEWRRCCQSFVVDVVSSINSIDSSSLHIQVPQFTSNATQVWNGLKAIIRTQDIEVRHRRRFASVYQEVEPK